VTSLPTMEWSDNRAQTNWGIRFSVSELADGEATTAIDELRNKNETNLESNDSFAFWKLDEEWRTSLSTDIEQSRVRAERYLFEQYLQERKRRPVGLDLYYAVKSLIPRAIRHRLNRLAVGLRAPIPFPGWPYEPALLALRCSWLEGALKKLRREDGWYLGFWPDGNDCCIVLTHDVESRAGLSQIVKMAELERKYGFRSAWNIPLGQFPIDWAELEIMRREGFELGAHGLAHDGRLFRSEGDFRLLGPRLERLARAHDLRGFRSPSTLRQLDLLRTMDFDFDSSLADTDPYEPQPGGSCSTFPFFLGQMVELPYTLPQDHTLINLVGRNLSRTWIEKAQWLSSIGAMILTLTHPDYSAQPPAINEYEELLKHLSQIERAWRALPSEVAAWWRRRSGIRLESDSQTARIVGGNATGASVKLLSADPLITAWRSGLLSRRCS
jgi:peptidoglycan/xylan/chitin deacetylase (PgdA/CDA1 family)